MDIDFAHEVIQNLRTIAGQRFRQLRVGGNRVAKDHSVRRGAINANGNPRRGRAT